MADKHTNDHMHTHSDLITQTCKRLQVFTYVCLNEWTINVTYSYSPPPSLCDSGCGHPVQYLHF